MAEGNVFFSSQNRKVEFRLVSHAQLEIIGQQLKKIPYFEEQMLESLLDLDKKIIQSSHRL